jgi:sulfate-transporting ATPase
LAVANLRRGRSGRQLLALRSNERAAAALGINVYSGKLYAFGVAGALAGLGGVVLAFTAQTVVFTQYSPLNSITAVSDLVIGGAGYIFGAFNGAQLAPSSFGSVVAIYWQSVDLYLPLIGGVGLLLTLMVAPDGNVHQMIKGLYRRPWVVSRRKRRRMEVAVVEATPRVTPQALSVESLSVRYGGVVAVRDLSLTVCPGEVVALIGPNGAGKTSFTDAVSGFTRAAGTVRLGDRDISDWSAFRRSRAGMVRSFQGLELFDGMTVAENLLAANDPRDAAALFKDLVHPGKSRMGPVAAAAAAEFGLLDDLDRSISELSFGQRKLISIARAVATLPSVLILDEPVAGLDDERTAEVARLVRRLATHWGMAVLVIEHDMNFVMSLSDRIVVMEFGRQVATGTPSEIATDEAAIAAYLGDEADEPSVSEPAAGLHEAGARR